jgi:hypothetical protein
MKIIKNIWKAWVTSLIGALIPLITGIVTELLNGSIDWTAVKTSLAPALILIFTDILKEIQNEVNPPNTTDKSSQL